MERRKKGGFEKIYQFEKTLVVSFKNVSQNNLTTNNNVYRPLIFINGSQIKSLLCSSK
jgi:hypothetical protein